MIQPRKKGSVRASSLKASPPWTGLIKNANKILGGVRDGKGWKVIRKYNIAMMQTSSASFSKYNTK